MSSINEPIDKLSLKLKSSIPKLMNKQKIPGLSLVIIKEGKNVLDLQFGVKNTVTHEPVIASTVFEGASFSKPLFSYAALKMCQQGLIELDRPLTDYYISPQYYDTPMLKEITLRHVLYHYSGFTEDHAPIDTQSFLEFKPGTQFLYSSRAFSYLNDVMAYLLNDSLAEYLQINVLKPLLMNDSSFIWEERYNKQAASPHDRAGLPIEKWHPKKPMGSCSLHTTPTDFAKFILEVIRQSKNAVSDSNLINMLDPVMPAEGNLLCCLGWIIEKTPDGFLYFQPGNNITFKALSMFYQKQEYGVIIMTNSANSYSIFPELINLTIGGSHEDLIAFGEFPDGDEKYRYFIDELSLSTWWKFYGF